MLLAVLAFEVLNAAAGIANLLAISAWGQSAISNSTGAGGGAWATLGDFFTHAGLYHYSALIAAIPGSALIVASLVLRARKWPAIAASLACVQHVVILAVLSIENMSNFL